MLTVDYDKLGVQPGDRLLDLGCGFGRHAFEAARRGASVVALDAGPEEVAQVRGTLGAMVEAGELAADHPAAAVQGDALALPFPDATFDRVIASEVLEHIPDDVAAMKELARVLRPGGNHGRDRAPLRSRGHQLGPLGRVPRQPGRPRAHLPALHPRAPALLDGPAADGVPPCPRPPFALLVAALRRRSEQRHQPGGRGVPQGAGVGHRQGPLRDARRRSCAEPAHRQEPGASI